MQAAPGNVTAELNSVGSRGDGIFFFEESDEVLGILVAGFKGNVADGDFCVLK